MKLTTCAAIAALLAAPALAQTAAAPSASPNSPAPSSSTAPGPAAPSTAPSTTTAPARAPGDTSAAPKTGVPTGTANGATLSAGDKAFIKEATQAGNAEVAAAKIALDKSSNQGVKDFAQHMVDDHTKAGDKLAAIAAAQGVTPPKGVDSAHTAQAEKLKKLNGAAFDASYIKGQKDDHAAAVALFTKESQSGKNPDLKAFAADTLPTLQEHKTTIDGMGGKKS